MAQSKPKKGNAPSVDAQSKVKKGKAPAVDLLEEIKALGGDAEDLALLEGIDEDDDEAFAAPDTAPSDKQLAKELKALVRSLDFGKNAAMDAESDDESDEGDAAPVPLPVPAPIAAPPPPPVVAPAPASVPVAAAEPVKRQKLEPPSGAWLVEPQPIWHAFEPTALPPADESLPDPPDEAVRAMQRRGVALLSALSDAYAAAISPSSAADALPTPLSKADKSFISSIISSGTAADRLSALVLLVQSSPMHATAHLNQLLTMCSKKSREENLRAVRSVVDWLAGSGLPADRKLRTFVDQREGIRALYQATHHRIRKRKKASGSVATGANSELPDEDVSERRAGDDWLVFWAFEDWLKTWYLSFLRTLETLAHDTLPFVRLQMVSHLAVLLRERPEQEHNLLRLLSSKLGDPDRSVASKTSDRILDTLARHSAMKTVIVRDVAALLLAPSASAGHAHSQYYGLVTLNQITLVRGSDQGVASKLLDVYFQVLNDLLAADKARVVKPVKASKGKGKAPAPAAVTQSEGESDNKTLAAVLTGINRAFPYTALEGEELLARMDTLFRIAHTGSFNVSIQALILIHHVVSSARSGADSLAVRFYRTLYNSLLDTRLATSSKQALYLNLLFKAMRADTSVPRSAAFVKRLVQTLASHGPAFICGALHLLGEVIAASPALRSMLTDPEDDDGEERFVDAPTEPISDDAASEADEDAVAPKADLGGYDARKREPLYAKAQSSCLWELVPLSRHWHPAVALHSREILSGRRPTTEADLEQHTLSRFLDRFAYRDTNSKSAAKGPSTMQPANAAVDAGAVRLRRGAAPSQRDVVNDPSFWSKDASTVPVDQLFFHRFFSRREREATVKDAKKARRKRGREEDDEVADGAVPAAGADAASDDGSMDEDEIFEAMMRSRGRPEGIEGGLSDDAVDADEDDDAAFAYSDDEEAAVDDAASDDDDGMSAFGEDADDLQGSDLDDMDMDEDSLFPPEPSTADAPVEPLKPEEVMALIAKPATDSKSRREKRRKLKHLGTFASADDWAALLEGEGDE